jgi:anti-sigma factor RsiW
MSQERCENVLLAIMAIADGEAPLLSAELVRAHLETCSDCRREAAQITSLATLFQGQKRREHSLNLWPAISQQLESAAAVAPVTGSRKWPAFLALGLLLVIYKLVEMIPQRNLGVPFKLVPLLFVIVIFVYVKENPFKINLELTLEGAEK